MSVLPLSVPREFPETAPASAPIASRLPASPRVLIINPLRHRCESLRSTLHAVLLTASIAFAASFDDAAREMKDASVDLTVAEVAVDDGDLIDAVADWKRNHRHCGRVMVVSSRKQPQIVDLLRGDPITGFFDESTEGDDALARAITQVESGDAYWSPSIVNRFIAECLPSRSAYASLTPSERLVLCAIGDGSDDRVAARLLGISANSVRSVRSVLHTKLHVRQRSELLQRAVELGFVYMGPNGIVRLGFANLLASQRAARELRAA